MRYFQDRLFTFFVIYDCSIFAPNYVLKDDYDRSSDIKFHIVFAVHTICLLKITLCCIWENVDDKRKKINKKIQKTRTCDSSKLVYLKSYVLENANF